MNIEIFNSVIATMRKRNTILKNIANTYLPENLENDIIGESSLIEYGLIALETEVKKFQEENIHLTNLLKEHGISPSDSTRDEEIVEAINQRFGFTAQK